jgi:hypothetical protein
MTPNLAEGLGNRGRFDKSKPSRRYRTWCQIVQEQDKVVEGLEYGSRL